MAKNVNASAVRRSTSGSRGSQTCADASSGGPVLEKVTMDTRTGMVHIPDVPGHPGYSECSPVRIEGTRFKISQLQHMGDRKTQEDRFILVPAIPGVSKEGFDAALFGVFDGTVGDFASDNVKDIVYPTLQKTPEWQQLAAAPPESRPGLLQAAIRRMYIESDQILLDRCSRASQHYATCTSVTVLLYDNLIGIAHLGDSRIVLGYENDGKLRGEQATIDHKPELPEERRRIEECGGMVERLINHSNKPFIRGGDFMMRKALSEQPMQLQYSRAFGGKDLKVFGLSSEPTVNVMRRPPNVRWAILASDGLWDVVSAQQAVNLAQSAVDQKRNPCTSLVKAALEEMAARKARADNITAVCIQFD